MSFFSTYAALRLTGNARNRPRFLGPLLRAFALICYCVLMLPVHILRRALELAARRAADPDPLAPAGRPTTAGGYPRSFQHHVADLQEDMR